MPVSVWAPVFVEWMHPAALIFALLLPNVRAVALKLKGHGPCYQTSLVAHDVASGFVFPSFLALALSGLSQEIAKSATGHAVELAGAMGIVYTMAGIFKGGHSAGANGGSTNGSSKFGTL